MNYPYKELNINNLQNSSTFNPLKAIFSSEEIFILKNKYDLEVNDDLMVNPFELYSGIVNSDSEIVLIKTKNYKIISNKQCEISLQLIGHETDNIEKDKISMIADTLTKILEIQKELN